MRNVLTVAVAAASLALAGMAAAQTSTTPAPSPPSAEPRPAEDTSKSKTTSSPAGSETTPHPTAAVRRAEHRVTGEVARIDHAKGLVTLKTAEGAMDLHFPPSALQGINEGDRVDVELGLRPAAETKPGKPTPQKSKTISPNPLSGNTGGSAGEQPKPKP